MYEVDACVREISTAEFEDVRFLVDNTNFEEEAVARVREFVVGLQGAGVAD